jgi:hypothetical protein
MPKETPLTPETLELLKQMKSIFVDPVEEERRKEELELRARDREQKKSDRERNHKIETERQAAQKFVQEACTHQRENGSYDLHGQKCCDGKYRFVCALCGCQFTPEHPDYNKLLNHPRTSKNLFGNARQE